jgi:hypothetical protein
MKEKIENLIKEVGVNEVDSILQEMKSKVNVKENIKKDFIELLSGCTISFDCDDIDYKKDGILLFYYQKNENIFRLKYDIWSTFNSKYNLNNQELKELLVGVVEEVLNYKGVTPDTIFYARSIIVKEVLNYKGVTPEQVRYFQR